MIVMTRNDTSPIKWVCEPTPPAGFRKLSLAVKMRIKILTGGELEMPESCPQQGALLVL